MKEKKFKAWDKKREILIGPFSLWDIHKDGENLEHGEGSVFSNREYELFDEKDYIFLQYTGRKDKNMIEIYENDLCEFTDYRGKVWIQTMHSLDNMHFWGHVSDNMEEIKEDKNSKMSYEVIGNNLENPELLVKKSK